MYAIKIDAVIPEDRRLIVDLPANVPVGLAEVIILSGGDAVTGRQCHRRQCKRAAYLPGAAIFARTPPYAGRTGTPDT